MNTQENNNEIHNKQIKVCLTLKTNDFINKSLHELVKGKLSIKKHTVLYEYLTENDQFVHPYVDIDADKLDNDKLNELMNDLINILNNTNKSYSIGGYTTSEELANKYKYLTVKQYKALSLHVVFYDVKIDRLYLLDYITKIFKNSLAVKINNKIIDCSVLKGYKTGCPNTYACQKFRLLFANKSKDEQKGADYVCIHDVDAGIFDNNPTDLIVSLKDITPEQVACTLLTPINECEKIETKDLKPSYLLAEEKKTKKAATKTTNDNNINNNDINKLASNNELNNDDDENNDAAGYVLIPPAIYFKFWNLAIKAGHYNEVICSDNYLQGYPFLPSLLLNAPYKLQTMQYYLNLWYNQIEHNHPEQIITYSANQYKEKHNNFYISLILKALKPHQFIDSLTEKEKNDYLDYLTIQKLPNNKLSHKQRELKTELTNIFNERINEFEKSRTKEEKHNIKLYNEFNNIVKYYGVLTYNDNSETINKYNYKYKLFKDSSCTIYRKVGNQPIAINKSDLFDMFPVVPKSFLAELLTFEVHEYIKLNHIYKFIDMEPLNTDKFFECLRDTFEDIKECDYFCKWLGMKLRAPHEVICRNICMLGGSGIFKTQLIESLANYFNFHKLNAQNDLNAQFNDYLASDILLIDEIPEHIKNAENIQNLIKEITSNKKITIKKKFEHTKTINNTNNIIINSNFENCGDIFRNQSENGELFRRFHIIKRKNFTNNENCNYIYEWLNDDVKTFSIVEALKALPPLSYTELMITSNYENWMHRFVVDVKENYAVLSLSDIKQHIKEVKGKKYLNIRVFVQDLNREGLDFKIAGIKNLLMKERAIDYIGGNVRKYEVINEDIIRSLFYREDTKQRIEENEEI